MNDRFKFRFFDKTIEFMGDVVSLRIQDDWALVRFSYADEETPDDEVQLSKGVLMQCTGSKDKNGKFIYEGDIIAREKAPKVFMKKRQVVKFYKQGYDIDFVHLQVVLGNVHENPELLEENE